MKQERVRPSAFRVSSIGWIFALAALLAVSAVFIPQAETETLLPATSQCPEDDSGALDIGGVKAIPGRKVRVPVKIQGAPNKVSAFGFEVTYPAQRFEFLGFEPGELAASFIPFDVTQIIPGRLRAAGVSTGGGIPQGAGGCLVWLNFQVKESQTRESQAQDSQENGPKNPGQGIAGIANPASVYCLKNGGKLEIRQDAEGGQYGVCIFSDGKECEEWAYFKGECKPEQKSECYSLHLENLKDDLAHFSSSQGCLCLSDCQGGDLNNDGDVTPQDALIAFRCYLKAGPCSECADVDNNGSVTPADALCIFKTYLGLPSCLDQQAGQPAPAPLGMEGEWKSQNPDIGGGKMVVDRQKQTVEMLDSPQAQGLGLLVNFQYTPTGGSGPISFQAKFPAGSIVANFIGTANNSLCPLGVWCIWAGQFLVDGSYSLKNNLGQLLDEGTFNLKYPAVP
ncbi:MAG: DUF333 domain-containing protein [bacterium]